MEIGIGLPTYVKGLTMEQTLEWARRAEGHGFSSLAVLDRLVYGNYEPLVTLSMAAAVTRRIRLMTAVMLTPYRNTAVLAKQAATLDCLSGGRLVLGVGLGGRADDYQAAGVPTRARGCRHSEQLAELKRIWAGENRGFAGAIGPRPGRPGGPQLLVGGESQQALRRAARFADGWIGRAGAANLPAQVAAVREAWSAAGRTDAPRIAALGAFALGPRAKQQVEEVLLDYYAYAGEHARRIADASLMSVEAVRDATEAFSSAGCDELLMFPASGDPAQIDLLAAATGG